MRSGILRVLLCLLLTLTAGGCGDDDGGIGPVTPGPQGEAGPQGDVGPQGGVGASDDAVAGSGIVTSQVREVAAFDSIRIAGEGDAVITQSAVRSVSVRSDDNLLPLITTTVEGSTLVVDKVDSVNDIDPTEGVRVVVSVPDVAALEITGAGSIEANGLSVSELQIVLEGSGSIMVTGLDAESIMVVAGGVGSVTLSGATDSQQVTLSGVVDYAAGELRSASCQIDSESINPAVVWVTGDLAVMGTGSIQYYGSPSVTGSGGVSLGEK